MARSQVNLSEDDQRKYTDIFMELDTDRNGWLSREEAGHWLSGAGYRLSEQQIENIFRIIDSNADGKITLDEFYNAMHLINNPPEETSDLLKVFRSLDTNGDGQLSEGELFNGLRKVGYSFSKQQVHRLFGNLDKDGNGQISFQEFWAAFKN